MKKLLFAVMSAALVFAVEAAQCEGKTKEGVRCKREAAENSKFCIGHADQAKKQEAKGQDAKKQETKKTDAKKPAEQAASEKLKDNGICWAVTEKGTRCKHKKEGASDYCKRHAADRKPAKPVKQCRALTWEGRQCERAPEPDCYYCKQHAKLGTGAVDAAGAVKAEAAPKAESAVKAEKKAKAEKGEKAPKAEKKAKSAKKDKADKPAAK